MSIALFADSLTNTAGSPWVTIALAILNTLQTIALAYLAARVRTNGKTP